MFDALGILIKRLLLAFFVVGGLMLGMFVAIGTLMAITVMQLVRRLRGPQVQSAASQGNVFEGEFSVVKPDSNRASILMVPPPTKPSSGG
jgi:hypothetical protein